MKTTATYHESYRPKQGFGARLLFCAFLLSLIGLSKAFAQVPLNDDCAGAITLTPSSTCNYISGSTLNATQSLAATCSGNSDDDVWYSFTAQAVNHVLSVQSGTNFDAVIDVMSGSCGVLNNINCTDATGNGGLEAFNISGLSIGSMYFIRVYHFGTGSGGANFQICVTDAAVPTATAATNINCSGFEANWNAVSGATAYFLDVSTDNMFATFYGVYSNLNVGTSLVSHITTNQYDSITLFYRVRASLGGSVSLNSNTISVSTGCSPGHFTSPQNGDTIHNVCDLHFCVSDSIAGIGFVYLDGDSNAIAASSLLGNWCFVNNIQFPDSITAGAHTFYYTNQWATNYLDSITVIFPNTLYRPTITETPANNGNYDFTINRLDPNLSYQLSFSSDGFSNHFDTVFSISGVSDYTFNHQYSYDGIYLLNSSITVNSCSGYSTVILQGDHNITVNNSGCSSALVYSPSIFNNTFCNVIDTITYAINFTYVGLLSNGTSNFTINWGDGNINNYPIQHNGNTDSAGYISISHLYTAPGVYTTIASIVDINACYTDTIIKDIEIGSNICGNLTGTIYNDADNDCSLNNGEAGIPYILVTATDGNNTYYAWTDSSGHYAFNLLNGTYTISPGAITAGYTVTCNNNQNISINNNTTNINFGLNCSGSFDAAITGISLWNGFFPGQADGILPHVGILNGGCNSNAVSGQVKIVLDACIQYTNTPNYSAAGTPDAVIAASTGDTLVWNVSDINNIGTFGYFDYAVNTLTCTSAQVGDSACITMMILPTNGDADPSNNTFTRCFEIGVSYDPNNKEVMPAGVGSEGFIPADEPSLTYTINFQNTGTATAWNIYVMDTIDSNLDINSIEILSVSHRMQVYTLPNRAVKFMFADIMLADSTHNERLSHGYVTFKIKLNPNLAPGTEIENTGNIYFDYNEAVVTNTTLNTIELPSSVKTIDKSAVVSVYPNPAKESVTVLTNSNTAGTITVTDVLGKTVKEVKINSEKTLVNTADLQSGVYFIKLTQNNVSKTEKIMITK